jgi:hypothetical protein
MCWGTPLHSCQARAKTRTHLVPVELPLSISSTLRLVCALQATGPQGLSENPHCLPRVSQRPDKRRSTWLWGQRHNACAMDQPLTSAPLFNIGRLCWCCPTQPLGLSPGGVCSLSSSALSSTSAAGGVATTTPLTTSTPPSHPSTTHPVQPCPRCPRAAPPRPPPLDSGQHLLGRCPCPLL